jgi:2-dehydro-3-deoxyphosphogluconate aldolase/(4S)-4-hydroxy-2-oxoglutarate aldolase
MVFKTSGNKYMRYTGYVLAVCSIMIFGLIVFLCTVREKKWAREMEEKTRELGLISIPGALTPSEATAANRAGADFVKLFPVTTMGTSYIKAIRAPLSHIKFLAVGGVNPDNVKDFMATGICGVGVGGGLANAAWVKEGRLAEIEALARSYVENVK